LFFLRPYSRNGFSQNRRTKKYREIEGAKHSPILTESKASGCTTTVRYDGAGTGGPRALVVDGATYVFARGADKNVWYVVRDASGYGKWHELTGISTQGDPAVTSSGSGRIDLIALGTDGLLYRRTMSGGYWNAWFQVDERTHFDAAPAAASSEPGRIDLVGRVGGDLVTASLVDGRWNAWALVPTAGRITAAPALVSPSPGSLDAYVVRKADGAVLRLPFSAGAWRPATVVSGLDGDGQRPEALVAGGQLYVFAGGEQSAGTGTPAPLPAGAAGPVGAVAADGTLELFVRTAEGTLARATANL